MVKSWLTITLTCKTLPGQRLSSPGCIESCSLVYSCHPVPANKIKIWPKIASHPCLKLMRCKHSFVLYVQHLQIMKLYNIDKKKNTNTKNYYRENLRGTCKCAVAWKRACNKSAWTCMDTGLCEPTRAHRTYWYWHSCVHMNMYIRHLSTYL